MSCWAVVAAFVAGGLAAAEHAHRRWIDGTIVATGIERDYKLYVPAGYHDVPASLMAMAD
jgi:poly(3-hydroxybutyrate) depolymerase